MLELTDREPPCAIPPTPRVPRGPGHVSAPRRVDALRAEAHRSCSTAPASTSRPARSWRSSARAAPARRRIANLLVRFRDPDAGARPARRPRPARVRAGRRPPRRRPCRPGRPPLPDVDPGEPPDRAPGRPATRISSRRSGAPAPGTGSRPCRRASTRRSARTARASRAVSVSDSRSHGPSSPTCACSSSTSSTRTSTTTRPRRSSAICSERRAAEGLGVLLITHRPLAAGLVDRHRRRARRAHRPGVRRADGVSAARHAHPAGSSRARSQAWPCPNEIGRQQPSERPRQPPGPAGRAAAARRGSSSSRTRNASSATATPRMMPISFGGSGPEIANVKNTATITRGSGEDHAAGVRDAADHRLAGVAARVLEVLLGGGQQEHGVVHRDREDHREEEHRPPGVQEALRLEAEERRRGGRPGRRAARRRTRRRSRAGS